MSGNDKIKNGYWSIVTQKHIKNYKQDTVHLDEVDNLSCAGKAGRLIGTIRGNGHFDNIKKLEKMASSVGIGKRELHRIILPELKKASDGEIEIITNTIGEITGIQEYIFGYNRVLEICGQVFENLGPTNIERIAIETMNVTKKLPHLESELKEGLNINGFKEQDIELACNLQTYFGLVQKLEKRGKEAIFSNEYVWGSNHKKIAHAVANLQLEEKQTLKEVIDAIQNYQGIPFENLPKVDNKLLLLAKKTGMINPTSITTKRGIEKSFGFSSNFIGDIDNFNDDILDDVKLLLASIRFGENYTQHSTIQSPERFLRYLINNKRIGPHTANGTDYTLLEQRGIIKVERLNAHSDRYFLVLLREDVAKEALRIVSNPNFSINISDYTDGVDAILNRGTFKSPEECRLELGKVPENVAEAMDYLTRTLRDETL